MTNTLNPERTAVQNSVFCVCLCVGRSLCHNNMRSVPDILYISHVQINHSVFYVFMHKYRNIYFTKRISSSLLSNHQGCVTTSTLLGFLDARKCPSIQHHMTYAKSTNVLYSHLVTFCNAGVLFWLYLPTVTCICPENEVTTATQVEAS